jgi:hypothetical protein
VRLETVFELASWMVGLGVPFAAVWWGTSRIRKRWARVYARILITPAFALVVALPVKAIAESPFERGEWRCTICGASDYQIRFWSHRLSSRSTSVPPDCGFESWYAGAIHEPHEHDWSLAIGCHVSSFGFACSFAAGSSYFTAISRIPSPEIAVSMVRRMQRASSAERLELIRGFPKAEIDEPFAALCRNESMTSEQFATAYDSWLRSHPEWQ